jgi:hypothetical protein
MLNIVTGSGNHVSVEIAFKVRQTGDPAKTAQLRRLDAVIFSQAVFSQPKYMKSKKSTILARAPPSLSSFFSCEVRGLSRRALGKKKKEEREGTSPHTQSRIMLAPLCLHSFFFLGLVRPFCLVMVACVAF